MLSTPVVCGGNLGGVYRIFSEKLTNQRQTTEGRGTQRRWLTVSDEFTVYMRWHSSYARFICYSACILKQILVLRKTATSARNSFKWWMQCKRTQWTPAEWLTKNGQTRVSVTLQLKQENWDIVLNKKRKTYPPTGPFWSSNRILERLGRLEQKIDRTEMETKRSNLKFIAVRKPQKGKRYTSGEQ